MRTTELLHGNGRRPAEPPIPFRQLLPMELKDKVSGKSNKQKDVSCLPEMMTLFSCLAEKNYDSNNCLKEAKEFQGCFNKFLEKNAQYKATGSLGILIPGLKASQLTSQQANTLLRKYPLKNLLKKVR
uniref:CHCH domain-containing protein n=1 Tax=Amblyomma triste TaxID=251400 RepID=A0A023G6R2_AMBTT